MLYNEEDVKKLIINDEWMMDIIRAVKTLNLPDWWICAGFVRSKVWDTLHQFQRTTIPDIDVIYYDPFNTTKEVEKVLEEELKALLPCIPWSVKNQARMHTVNKLAPYTSSIDAISKFPETATALGVKLDLDNRLILAAPCGLDDVINLRVRPTDFFKETEERREIYQARLRKKNWIAIWNKIDMEEA
ncbi:nucleotidyltransferase family protein [Sutcliffiella halmapala]|uniref:nucleotidyltransferase family protein n=1 Tax=Sutcliffiella halmapala TaxID=79882 RepID=UPI0009956F39|nr:nucleotidyltransferase family protein [Sutcliffiella halmapala]